ncbi:Uncharacterised protein [Vibrio cholerae]|nr:Uncharacterised protein [Vibrio cholerae]CSI84718.1 Uncharacterised protein [Vibrio cholerae]
MHQQPRYANGNVGTSKCRRVTESQTGHSLVG